MDNDLKKNDTTVKPGYKYLIQHVSVIAFIKLLVAESDSNLQLIKPIAMFRGKTMRTRGARLPRPSLRLPNGVPPFHILVALLEGHVEVEVPAHFREVLRR